MRCRYCGINGPNCACGNDFSTTAGYLNIRSGSTLGTIDLDTGALMVGGQIVASEPDLSTVENYFVVGKFGHRLAGLVKRIVRAAPLRKLAGAFGTIAAQVAHIVPDPYGAALSSAARVSSVVSRIGRGDTSARASIANLAQVALDATNPNNQRARLVMNSINEAAQGRIPPIVQTAYHVATSAANVAEGLIQGDPQAMATARTLVAMSPNDRRAAFGLSALRNAFRERTVNRTSGIGSDIAEAAQLLWGNIKPHVGVRPSADLFNYRDAYRNGVSLMAQRRGPPANP